MSERRKALSVLAMNTIAFTACFAVWMMNGVLVTFLVDSKVFAFDKAQMGWLIGIPVLTGALLRLPMGMLTDRFGGRPVFVSVMIASALAAYLTSHAAGFWGFLLGGLAFGIAGSSFAVGVAYTSVWFPREQQGTALGVFGMGNAGAALTSLFAPRLLAELTEGGTRLEAWRELPRLYAQVAARRGGPAALLGRRYAPVLARIQRLMADTTEFVERVENALKVTDDVYLARIYSAALEIFRGRTWRAGIDRKLGILRDTYSTLSGEAQAARSELLELAIVALIVLEIVFAFVRG